LPESLHYSGKVLHHSHMISGLPKATFRLH